MDTSQLAEMNPQDRILFLQDNAAKVEQTTYQKPLTAEELDQKREQLADNAIKLSEMEDEFQEVKDSFKERMKPLTTKNKALLLEIKTKKETADGTLYHLANHESGFMETYNSNGQLISTRRLRPEEKQSRIFQMQKAS